MKNHETNLNLTDTPKLQRLNDDELSTTIGGTDALKEHAESSHIDKYHVCDILKPRV
ncbi:MAG: hypothetical protein LBJ95_03160 [Oscillospiraceae bacterium]|nr:hypothetical protein [Oscillospiraceae bacterium]